MNYCYNIYKLVLLNGKLLELLAIAAKDTDSVLKL